ncbi:MAG: hypothetical protein CVT69_00145 [Actinobacteria bacterium HGW-Actinobacteria-9]|nr:MAG: hypothetical protein CVT69_00145 [Actinobacteria bacterium HGW-Actinobacteria-9]
MTFSPEQARVAALAVLYDARTTAELADAAGMLPGSDRIPHGGDLHAGILLVKGLPGPAEETGAPVLSGPDGDAALRALGALGVGGAYCAVLSRPGAASDERAVAMRLRHMIESIDPWCVIALDGVAALDVSQALGCPTPDFGVPVRVTGRSVVAVDGLEASLTDPIRKKRVWSHLKAVALRAPLW